MSFNSRSLPPPTAEQLKRWTKIRAKGCIACLLMHSYNKWQTVEIHHMKSGNVRMGHDFTIGLCSWHHRGEIPASLTKAWMDYRSGPSLANGSKVFHDSLCSDDSKLLAYQNKLIRWTSPPVRERKRKSRCTASAKTVPRPDGWQA